MTDPVDIGVGGYPDPDNTSPGEWVFYEDAPLPYKIGVYRLLTTKGNQLYALWNGHFWPATTASPLGALSPSQAGLSDLAQYKIMAYSAKPLDQEVPLRCLMIRTLRANPSYPKVYLVCIPVMKIWGYSKWDGHSWGTLMKSSKGAHLSEGKSSALNGGEDAYWYVQGDATLPLPALLNFMQSAYAYTFDSKNYTTMVVPGVSPTENLEPPPEEPIVEGSTFSTGVIPTGTLQSMEAKSDPDPVARMAASMVDALVLLNGYDNGISKKAAYEVCFKMIEALTEAGFPVPDLDTEQPG